MSLLPLSSALMKAKVSVKVWCLFTTLQGSQKDSNVEENITSIKMQEDPLHDNMFFTRDLNQGLCHVTLQYAVL